jgi:hypothetical protein
MFNLTSSLTQINANNISLILPEKKQQPIIRAKDNKSSNLMVEAITSDSDFSESETFFSSDDSYSSNDDGHKFKGIKH